MKRILLYISLIAVSCNVHPKSYNDEIAAYRQKYKADFLTDPNSPLKASDTAFLRFYAPDSSYRVSAQFTASPNSKPFMIETHSGRKKPYREYGVANFSIKGVKLQLHIYQSLDLMKDPEYKDNLFIPFTDTTNYTKTFAGGRYIDLSIKDIRNGSFILDFNKCYNPYCAFADGYSCPLPPRENALPVGIEAGEQLYGKSIAE